LPASIQVLPSSYTDEIHGGWSRNQKPPGSKINPNILSSLEKVVINFMFGTEDSINYRFTFGHTKPQVSNDISRKPEKKEGENQLFNN